MPPPSNRSSTAQHEAYNVSEHVANTSMMALSFVRTLPSLSPNAAQIFPASIVSYISALPFPREQAIPIVAPFGQQPNPA